MKPFDLKAALRGDPVVTRGGSDVKIAGDNPDAATSDGVVAGWICPYTGSLHDTKEEAEELAGGRPVARVTWEE